MVTASVASAGYWSALAFGGLACGLINALASSGSAVSLPLLVILGLSDGVANATNRLPVLVGSAMATWTFAKRRQLHWRSAAFLVPPALAGSVAGALVAESLSNRQVGLLITGAVLIALLLLFTKIKEALFRVAESPPQVTFSAVVLIAFVGFWLGLVVLDGATYLLLVLMLGCGFQLTPANALKSIILAVTTMVPVAMFWDAGEMLWAEGTVMAAGSVLGGHIGARLSNHVAARVWVFRLLVVAISLELLHTGWHYMAPLRAAIAS